MKKLMITILWQYYSNLSEGATVEVASIEDGSKVGDLTLRVYGGSLFLYKEEQRIASVKEFDPLFEAKQIVEAICNKLSTAAVIMQNGDAYVGNVGGFVGKNASNLRQIRNLGLNIGRVYHIHELVGNPNWTTPTNPPYFRKGSGKSFIVSISPETVDKLKSAFMIGCDVVYDLN